MKDLMYSNDFQVKNNQLEKQNKLKQDLIKFLNEVINSIENEDNKKTIVKADKLIKRINKIL